MVQKSVILRQNYFHWKFLCIMLFSVIVLPEINIIKYFLLILTTSAPEFLNFLHFSMFFMITQKITKILGSKIYQKMGNFKVNNHSFFLNNSKTIKSLRKIKDNFFLLKIPHLLIYLWSQYLCNFFSGILVMKWLNKNKTF